MLAAAGATQIEPGHGLTGTTPLHVVRGPAGDARRRLSSAKSRISSAARLSALAAASISIRSSPTIRSRRSFRASRRQRQARWQPVEIPAARLDRLLRDDRRDRRGKAAHRRQRRLRLPAAGLRHARLYGRRRRPLARRARVETIYDAFGRACGLAVVRIGHDDRMPRPVLSLQSIHKTFGGVVAIEKFDLDVRAGEIVALVGDNGAGKSTLIKIIAGVQPPTSGSDPDRRRGSASEGSERLAGARHSGRLSGPRARRQPARLHEHVSWPGADHVPLGKLNRKRMIARDGKAGEANSTCASLRRSATIRDLSGGQRQGVAIARATHWATKLVLMDEPTAALGVAETARVERIIQGLKARNLAILIVSHSLDQVFRLSDRICVLRRGSPDRGAGHALRHPQRNRGDDHRPRPLNCRFAGAGTPCSSLPPVDRARALWREGS